jgi:hypothetical protein
MTVKRPKLFKRSKLRAGLITGSFGFLRESFVRRHRFAVTGLAALATVMLTALIPLAIYHSLAGSNFTPFEAESGVLNNAALLAKVADTSASGGSYIRFNLPACPAGQQGTWPNCTAGPPNTCPKGQTGTPPSCSWTRPQAALVPPVGALLGISSDDGGSGMTVLEDASHLGRKFDTEVRFTDFDSAGSGMLNALTNNIADDLANNRTPILTWQIHNYGATDYLIDNINAGQKDTYITQVAQKVKAIGKPIMIRYGHEMNGNWEPWSGCTGNTCKSDAGARYVAAWQHTVNIFRAQGATNAIWIWCPNGNDVPAGVIHWTQYYPGDSYVDWVGIDQYVHKQTDQLATVLGSGANSIYGDYAGKKPVFITETMTGPRSTDAPYTDKTIYFNNMLSNLQTKFPSVAGIAFFDHNKSDGDYRINASAASMSAFLNMGKSCYLDATNKSGRCP